ncbi:MAG: NAD(P)-binding protein [Propioniciclava sp.]|uniref:FAD-dependent oxidoreductase n=1 Tax=Propioniciclava sp. TaxID=2038686 RepID=UPI0039E270EC
MPTPLTYAVAARPAPCDQACAAGEPVRDWLGLLAGGGVREAWGALVEANPLPAVLGRICYADCERDCNRGGWDGALAIRECERVLGDHAIEQGWALPAPRSPEGGPRRVAVVGSGPCGLSAAYQLARAGHEVVLHEAHHALGGMLRRGISERRLPKAILDAEIGRILTLGVRAVPGSGVRRIEDALRGCDAVVWAAGASMCMAIVPGRTLWRQPVHTDRRVRRTATVSLGRGRRAARALIADFAGRDFAEAPAASVVGADELARWYYPAQPPILAKAAGSGLQAAVAEAGRCLTCGDCSGCGNCQAVCPFGAVLARDGVRFAIDPDACCGCHLCAPECPTGAIVRR